jgi:cysteine desulfurase/selenocysteine lyase
VLRRDRRVNVKKIREDFPILKKEINGKPLIYLDSACMTLKPKQVIDALLSYYNDFPVCGGRSVHKMGTEVTIRCDGAREKIKNFLNADSSNEIIFTKNTTEGLNLVAHGLDLKKGDRVLTTDREHNSNLAPWHIIKNSKGINHEVVPSNPDNTFDLDGFNEMMDKDVKLVSMVHTSNLDGYTIPAKEIIKIAHEHDAIVMLDGSQSAAHKHADLKDLDVDFFACSIHKMCGPTGMGVLYGKLDLLQELKPFVVGGGTLSTSTYDQSTFLDVPDKFESGLQDFAGMIGSGAAIDYLANIGMDSIQEHELKLNNKITEGLKDIENLHILGPEDPNLRGGITGFIVEDMDSHDLAMILDETENIMVRSGMHCVHSWFNARNIRGSARTSVYLYNTEEEVDFFITTLKRILKEIK